MPDEPPAWTPELLEAPHDAPDKAGRVRRMFNRIAPRYELVNTILSAGRDAMWRRRAVALAGVGRDDRVLDIGCGTGDFARAFAKGGVQTVVGCDFAHEMLVCAARSRSVGVEHARACGLGMAPGERPPSIPPWQGGRLGMTPGGKHSRGGRATGADGISRLQWCEADAMCLPFRSGSFSVTACAFSVRNFADLDGGLAEMYRVLQRGGRAVILEFTRPRHRLARFVYELYFHHAIPMAGALISGDRSGAYRYLPRSVVTFLDAEEMGLRLRRAGFSPVTTTPLTMGAVTVFVATRD